MGVDIDPPSQGTPYLFFGYRITDPGCVVVDQVFLEFLYLFIGEDLPENSPMPVLVRYMVSWAASFSSNITGRP
jgi:hypothetical protein